MEKSEENTLDEKLKQMYIQLKGINPNTPVARNIEKNEHFRGFRDGYKGQQQDPPGFTWGDLNYDKGYDLGENSKKNSD